MANRTIIVKSDYNAGDSLGPLREATSGDTVVDGNGNIINPSYVTVSNSYVLLTTNYGLFVTASATPIIITLPSASGNTNRTYNIIRTDNNGTQVTLTSSNGTISNNSTVGILPLASVNVISNGSKWFIY